MVRKYTQGLGKGTIKGTLCRDLTRKREVGEEPESQEHAGLDEP
jgi:hypothetical protein